MTWLRPVVTRIDRNHAVEGSNRWDCGPTLLNTDDLVDIVDALESIWPGDVTVMSHTGDGILGRPLTRQEMKNLSAADAQRMSVSVHSSHSDLASGDPLDLSLQFSPTGVSLTCTPESQKCGSAGTRILDIVRNGRRGQARGQSVMRILMAMSCILLLGLWAWTSWTWRSLPGALLAALLTLFTLRTVRAWSKEQGEVWENAPARRWLELKSRAELRTERANRHRDLRVAILSIVVGLVVGFVLGTLKRN